MKLILSTTLLSTALYNAQASTLRNCDTREPYVYVAHYTGTLTQEEHEAHAVKCGGHIASVTTIDEFDEINDLIKDIPSNGYERTRWWIGASREWQGTTRLDWSWSDGSEWDLFNSVLTEQIGIRTGSNCFLYNDNYPSNYIYSQYKENENDELDFLLWSAAVEDPAFLLPAVYLLPSSYTNNGNCDATNFYAMPENVEEPEIALDTCSKCSDAIALDVEEDSDRVGQFGYYGAISCSQITERNAEVMCAGTNDVGLYDGLEVEGEYFLGELFRQFCPYKCKKLSSITTCQAEDFPLEFDAAGQEGLTCSMVANNLDLCEDDAIWWTCPQACFSADAGAAPTAAPTAVTSFTDTTVAPTIAPTSSDTTVAPTIAPTSASSSSTTTPPFAAPTVDCNDSSSTFFVHEKIFVVKSYSCSSMATKSEEKRRSLCNSQTYPFFKDVEDLCKETCGQVGVGVCSHLENRK